MFDLRFYGAPAPGCSIYRARSVREPEAARGLERVASVHDPPCDVDVNLVGINADYRVHVSEALLSMNDEPMLEHGIKATACRIIRLPGREADYRDRGRLTERFARFELER